MVASGKSAREWVTDGDSERREALVRIVVRERASGAEHEVTMSEPVYSLRLEPGCDFDTDTIRFTISTPIRPNETYNYDMARYTRTLVQSQAGSAGLSPERYSLGRLWATAWDGERIPVSVVHRRDLPLDGSAPCLLYGYGAYGWSVDPAFAPVEPLGSTVHYTEFSGVGIVNLPALSGTPIAADERQLLSVNIATCDGADCVREPVAGTLAQVSAGEITSRGASWLATNEEGNVAFEVSALEGESIDVMLDTVGAGAPEPRFACTNLDTGQRLAAAWVDGREGSFVRVSSPLKGDIRCDVTLARTEGAA